MRLKVKMMINGDLLARLNFILYVLLVSPGWWWPKACRKQWKPYRDGCSICLWEIQRSDIDAALGYCTLKWSDTCSRSQTTHALSTPALIRQWDCRRTGLKGELATRKPNSSLEYVGIIEIGISVAAWRRWWTDMNWTEKFSQSAISAGLSAEYYISRI